MKIIFSKIKSIKSRGIEKTYDFAVKDEHRIIARNEGSKNGFYTSNCWHGDIEEFITAKQTPGKLTKFNMSVGITDEFMYAVKNHLPWKLIFPDFDTTEFVVDNAGIIHKFDDVKNMQNFDFLFKTIKSIYKETWDGNINTWIDHGLPIKIYKTFKDANELWDLIMQSTYNRNEPGILFIDTINKMNNLKYCEYINATNPCVIGDTLIFTNIGWIKIRNLYEKKYNWDDIKIITIDRDGILSNSMLKNVMLTEETPILFKVSFSNGEFLIVNDKHKFYSTTFEELCVSEIYDKVKHYLGEVKVLGYNQELSILDIEQLNYTEPVYDLTAEPNFNFFSILNKEEIIITTDIVVNDTIKFKYFDILVTTNGQKFAYQLNENDDIEWEEHDKD